MTGLNIVVDCSVHGDTRLAAAQAVRSSQPTTGVSYWLLGAALAALSISIVTPGEASGLQRAAQTEDMTRVHRLDDLAIAPDGRRAIYRDAGLNAAGDQREHSLWSIDLTRSSKPVPFTTNHSDSDVQWSPDGTKIAFLRDLDGQPQIHVVSASGGSPCVATGVAAGVDSFQWSPDGLQIAFSSVTPDPSAPPTPLPHGVRVFTRADYRSGDSYADFSAKAQIWVVNTGATCASGSARRLTALPVSSMLSFWSVDGKSIYFTTNDTAEPYYGGGRSSLRRVQVASGIQQVVQRLTVPGKTEDLETAPEFVPSPDGRQVAFTIGDPRAPSDFAQDDIFVMNLATGAVRNVTAKYDREVGQKISWIDDNRLLAIGSDAGAVNLVQVDLKSEKVTPIWEGSHNVSDFVRSRSGRVIATRSDFTTPVEVYEVMRNGKARPLTAVNQPIRDELILTTPEEVTYKEPGGATIHGFLQFPPNFDPAKRYPLIVWLHGGPYDAWYRYFNGQVQAISAAGYLVFSPNPGGSASYGQAYANRISKRWPGNDFEDIMAGVDYLSNRAYVDTRHVGIAGISAGGVLTDWAIGHTDRFAAAVSISDIADFSAYWFVGDQPNFRARDGGNLGIAGNASPNSPVETATPPWLSKRDIESSPITYGLNIKTPTLLIGGDRDYRTPISAGSEMMFRLLKYLKVPTAFVQFEGAGHTIYGSTDPRHYAVSTHYLIRWMDRFLKGKSVQEFDDVHSSSSSLSDLPPPSSGL